MRTTALFLLLFAGCRDDSSEIPRSAYDGRAAGTAARIAPERILAETQAALRAGTWEVVFDHLPGFVRTEWTARLIEIGAAYDATEAARDDLRRLVGPLLAGIATPSAERALERAIEEFPGRRDLFSGLMAWMRANDVRVHVLDSPRRRHVSLHGWLAEPGEWKVRMLRDNGSHLDGPRKAAVVEGFDGQRMSEDEAGFLLFHYDSEGRWAVWPWRREPPLAKDQVSDEVFAARASCTLYTQMVAAWRERRGRVPRNLGELVDDPPPSLLRVVTDDPWGNEYRLVAEGDALRVCSAGPDGRWETADDIRPTVFPD